MKSKDSQKGLHPLLSSTQNFYVTKRIEFSLEERPVNKMSASSTITIYPEAKWATMPKILITHFMIGICNLLAIFQMNRFAWWTLLGSCTQKDQMIRKSLLQTTDKFLFLIYWGLSDLITFVDAI